MLTAIARYWSTFVGGLSGEFFMRAYKHPNSGAMVVLRTIWIGGLIILVAAGVEQTLDPERNWTFSWAALVECIHKRDAVIIIGAVYAALYARFSSQWTYLANLYNQIKQTEVQAANSTPSTPVAMAQWKAGFVEDAFDLHLAAKPSIATIIVHWVTDPVVAKELKKYTPDFNRRWEIIERLANELSLPVPKRP